MTKITNQNNRKDNQANKQSSCIDSVRILSDLTRRDFEKSYNIDNTNENEVYYRQRYGRSSR